MLEYLMTDLIRQLEAALIERKLPDFAPGDTVVVQVKVVEGTRERLQAFEGRYCQTQSRR